MTKGSDMPARRVFKWDVRVDDRPHSIGAGPVLLVACQHAPDSVQVWTEENPLDVPVREVQVFGTFQPLDEAAGAHIGSAIAAAGALVWHVYELIA